MKFLTLVLCLSFFTTAFASEVETDCLAMNESRDSASKVAKPVKTEEVAVGVTTR